MSHRCKLYTYHPTNVLDIIKLLPDSLANQIAAGEVVQRPASVVKELLENAIDAKSTDIKLIIKDSGKQLIQVIDNGVGMSQTDARMSFERHATSKINNIDDLMAIKTLGFRGEALASIAAVSQVTLKTKQRDEEIGSLLSLDASKIIENELTTTNNGTSIAVKNLFYNVPARKKFLKNNNIELRHIIDEFIRVAIPNPNISFSLNNDGEELYGLRTSSLKQRIINVLNKKYESQILPIEGNTALVNISGFIGKPEAASKKRGDQFIFLNNRYIRDRYLERAITNAYEDIISYDCYPVFVIMLSVPFENIDINVHPTKTEVKFIDQKAIFSFLESTIRRTINQAQMAPTLTFETENIFDSDDKRPQKLSAGLGYSTSGGSFTTFQNPNQQTPDDWSDFYKLLSKESPKSNDVIPSEEVNLVEDNTNKKDYLQLHNKFIISSLKSGLLIVHQNLAHQRVIYERCLAQFEDKGNPSQKMLFPEVIELSTKEKSLFNLIKDNILHLGFILEDFGKDSLLLTGIPANMPSLQDNNDVKNLITKLFFHFENDETIKSDEINERTAASFAKVTAIPSGKMLLLQEMQQLIDELFACETPFFSPSGKPTIITIPEGELNKKFGF